MRVCCLSDLHGHFPEVPPCDLLILAGDYAPAYKHHPVFFYRDQMAPWVADAARNCQVVGIAGNHDLLFEKRPDLVPQMEWTYLQDSGTIVNGLRIWGTPWQPRFFDWAFNLDEPELCERWALIPDDTDILITHGPPRGYGDWSTFNNERCGSAGLLARIESVRPGVAVAGHIHDGYGRYQIGKTLFVSASYVDEDYRPRHRPQVVEVGV